MKAYLNSEIETAVAKRDVVFQKLCFMGQSPSEISSLNDLENWDSECLLEFNLFLFVL